MINALKSFAAQRRELTDSVALFFASWAFFLFRIQFPTSRNFDEFHYIPSALQWLGLTENQNWEHPPLAKLLIAIGVGLFGDEPFGWRFMSTLSGALTLVGMYHLALALFRNRTHALWVAAITILNQLLYVQARIAMLDTFMVAFLVWSLTFLVNALLSEEKDTKNLLYAGICMGFAIACKWFAVVAMGTSLGLIGLQALYSRKYTRIADAITFYVMPMLGAYFITFLPYLWVERNPPFSIAELLTDAQTRMLDGQQRVVTEHPYMSEWWQWPIMQRPIWYAFDRIEGSNLVRGVLLLGNPVVMYGGLLAILFCIYDVIRKKSATALIIVILFLAFSTCWIAIPRKVSFYYYYYPAGMILSLALVHWFFRVRTPHFRYIFLGVTLGIFIYFFPILSAMKIPGDSFTRWMWLRTWI